MATVTRATLVYWGLLPLFETTSQLLMKKAALSLAGEVFGLGWLERALTSPWFVASMLADSCCFVVWMMILKDADLGRAFPATSVSYVGILVASHLLFQDAITMPQVLGTVLIISGLGVMSLRDKSSS